MARELAFVLINPYTITKSRTGGVIARYISRTDLNFVAARMFGPSKELVEEYAAQVQQAAAKSDFPTTTELIAGYVRKSYAPAAASARRRRVMMLLFEGEDAIHKIWEVTGGATLKMGSGQTIRDTYGDFVVDEQNRVQYFEPAVLVAPTLERASAALRLWAWYSAADGGLVEASVDVDAGQRTERTLVLLKPDNFRFRSSRPGNIIDSLSLSGLRIVCVKKFAMTVGQAEEFYGPVREGLARKFHEFGAGRAAVALSREFGFAVPEDSLGALCEALGPLFAQVQFEEIIKFMTGHRPSECASADKATRGDESCLALVYDGEDAVRKIRALIGPTDPSKASPGSVRREFGSDIMVNAAHASDSAENAAREMRIIRAEEDTIKPWVDKYYGV